jgi:hypothetical protein
MFALTLGGLAGLAAEYRFVEWLRSMFFGTPPQQHREVAD